MTPIYNVIHLPEIQGPHNYEEKIVIKFFQHLRD